MPVTPFHFGPGAALHALAPRRVSFLAFCAANVIIDIESLYHLVTQRFPVHGFLHSYVGATLITGVTVTLFLGAKAIAARVKLPDLWAWQSLTPMSIAVGAAAGGYSHIVLDSIMHPDMSPLAPFSESNGLLRAIPLGMLHWICLGSGAAGLLILGVRRLLRGEDGAPRRK